MSAFLLSVGLLIQALKNAGSSVVMLEMATATDIGPSQFTERSTSLESLSMETTVNTVTSFLFYVHTKAQK